MDSTPEQNDWPARVGQVVAGKYLIEDVIGSGGMGVVFRARHLLLDERVALKMPHTARAKSRSAVTRFLREARSATRLTSDHVVRVRDVDAPNGAPYLVMEYLEGRDLGRLLKSEGRQTVERSVGWALAACEALAEAHALGIVHRDIKPSNLFLASRAGKGEVLKLLDFGIAHDDDSDTGAVDLTRSNELLGSPRYMSPEQVRQRDKVGPKSDIWSLGVVLYELISGRGPFPGVGPSAVLAAIIADAPRSLDEPQVPAELEAVILRCLEKDPAARFPDVVELARALSPFAKKGAERVDAVVEAHQRGKVQHPRAESRADLDAGVPTAEPVEAPAADQTASNWGEPTGGARPRKPLRQRRVLQLGVLLAVLTTTIVGVTFLRGEKRAISHAEESAPVVASPSPIREVEAQSAPTPAKSSVATAPPAEPNKRKHPGTSALPRNPAPSVVAAPAESVHVEPAPPAKPTTSSPFAVDKTVDTRM